MLAQVTRPRWASEAGAELIEFAIILPMMLLIVFGIVDFGLLLQRYQVVTNAAREGARIAVLPGYLDADVQARVSQFLVAGGLTQPAVTTVLPVQTLTVGAQCFEVRPVTVNYPYSYSAVGQIAAYFDGTGFSITGLRATATMRNETASGACP